MRVCIAVYPRLHLYIFFLSYYYHIILILTLRNICVLPCCKLNVFIREVLQVQNISNETHYFFAAACAANCKHCDENGATKCDSDQCNSGYRFNAATMLCDGKCLIIVYVSVFIFMNFLTDSFPNTFHSGTSNSYFFMKPHGTMYSKLLCICVT